MDPDLFSQLISFFLCSYTTQVHRHVRSLRSVAGRINPRGQTYCIIIVISEVDVVKTLLNNLSLVVA